jgi:hypothetical protein
MQHTKLTTAEKKPMRMTWFKLQSGIRNDPKLKRIPIHQRYAYIVLMCLASESEERGTIIDLEDEDLAFELEMSVEDWKTLKAKFRVKGLIEFDQSTLTICDWETTQYDKPSDRAEETRQRKREQRARDAAKKAIDDATTTQDVTPVTPLSREMSRDVTPLSRDVTRNVTQIRLEEIRLEETRSDQDPEKEKKQEKKEIRGGNRIRRNRSNSPEPNCEEPDLEISRDLNQKIACAEKPTFETDLENVPPPSDQTLTGFREFKPLQAVNNDLPSPLSKAENKPLKLAKSEASDFEVFREVFNQDKPIAWARCEKLTEARIKKLNALAKEHGDRTIEVFQDALAFCRSDEWYRSKNFSIDNLLTNDKVTALAERSRASPNKAGSGLANELATEAARLADFFRSKREQQND